MHAVAPAVALLLTASAALRSPLARVSRPCAALAPGRWLDYDPVPTGQTCAERAGAWALTAAEEDARLGGWAGAGLASFFARQRSDAWQRRAGAGHGAAGNTAHAGGLAAGGTAPVGAFSADLDVLLPSGELGAAFEYALKRSPPKWLWLMHTPRAGASAFARCTLEPGWRRKGRRICALAEKSDGAALLVEAHALQLNRSSARAQGGAQLEETRGAAGRFADLLGIGGGTRGRSKGCTLLVSNDDLSIAPILPPRSALATVVREPVQRLVSSYRLAVGMAARTAFCSRTSLDLLKCVHPIIGEDTAPHGAPEAQAARESGTWPWTLIGPMMVRDMQRRAAAMSAATVAAEAIGNGVANATIRAALASRLQERPFDVPELYMPLADFARHPLVLGALADGQTLSLAGLSHLSLQSSGGEDGRPPEPLQGIRSKATSAALVSLGKCARAPGEARAKEAVARVALARLVERATFVGLGGTFEAELETSAQFMALMRWKRISREAVRAELRRGGAGEPKKSDDAHVQAGREYARCTMQLNPALARATAAAAGGGGGPSIGDAGGWASNLLRVGAVLRTDVVMQSIDKVALEAIRQSNQMDAQLFLAAKELFKRRKRAMVDAGRL